MVVITPKPILKASYYRIGARYYDSDIGGWVSVDPMRQFNSPFLYASNNPTTHFDADGMVDPYPSDKHRATKIHPICGKLNPSFLWFFF